MSTFESQVEAAEKRHGERAANQAANEALLRSGEPFKADTSERVHKWFRRRGFSASLAEQAIKSGEVPLSVQASMQPLGQLEPLRLERVLGTSDFLGIAFLERGLQIAKTVGRISVRGRTGSPTGYGTGFLVGPRLLLTNNHVLADEAQAGDSVVEFDFFVRADGTPSTIKVFNLQPEVFFKTDPTLDFTLVAVSPGSANGALLWEQGWNQLIPEEGKAIIGQWVNIIQHPNGEPKQLVLRNNEIVDIQDQFLTYRTDTSPGSSGSPVYNDQWEVVALHHAGKPARDAAGHILDQQGRPWQSWMGEHQIRWESNEGARISHIVSHIEALPLNAEERVLFHTCRQPCSSRAVTQLAEKHSEYRSGDTAGNPSIAADGTATWTIPLRVSLSLGGLAASVPSAASAPTALSDDHGTWGTTAVSTTPSVPTSPVDERSLLDAAKVEFLKRPEVLGVRLGYRFENGWITPERAVVITVADKKTRFDLKREGRAALPQSFAGYPVQLSGPTLLELVSDGQALTREFFSQTESLPFNEILYTPPSEPLVSVNERMKLKLHVSPDAGWPCLQAFLAETRDRLVIGMYDFGAKHILEAILAKPDLNEIVLVMQSGESLGTGTKKDDLPDAEVARLLHDQFADRFHFGWVKLGPKNGWVANSYHIKVVVQDSQAFWLSSGNWQSSNQPLGNLASDKAFSYLNEYNREWNAIVYHEGLAKTFEAYLRNDLKKGSTPDFTEKLVDLPNIAVPVAEIRQRSHGPNLRYFPALELDEQVRVTPLLTPDNYFDAAIELIKSAKHEILLQNQTFNAPREHQGKLTELVRLIQEKQRSIPVRIIFRLLMASDARRNLEALVEMGFDSENLRVQKNLHTKGIIVDGQKVLLGSQNISETGISINRDASLLFEHEGIASYFKEIFEHDWNNLALKDIGDSFRTAWSTNEVSLEGENAESWVLLGPKDYLPLL